MWKEMVIAVVGTIAAPGVIAAEPDLDPSISVLATVQPDGRVLVEENRITSRLIDAAEFREGHYFTVPDGVAKPSERSPTPGFLEEQGPTVGAVGLGFGFENGWKRSIRYDRTLASRPGSGPQGFRDGKWYLSCESLEYVGTKRKSAETTQSANPCDAQPYN